MKVLLALGAVVVTALVMAAPGSAYTFADVSGTQTLDEQNYNITNDSFSYDQTLSNGDDVLVEAGQDLAPTCVQTITSFCPSSRPARSPVTTTNVTTNETCTTNLGTPCLTDCPGPWYEVGYHGTVRYRNHLGYLLWRYRQVLWYYYCPSLYPQIVEKVAKLNSLSDYTNYGWGWNGTVDGPSHNSLPDSWLETYSKGWFQVCTPILKSVYCENRYPHIRLYANGLGHLTAMKWGITSS